LFRSFVVLFLATLVIAMACHFLVVGVQDFAIAANVPLYFSAVVLGAAATSVPDTVLSLKSARRGDYDDAVANAVGSNIFDITVAIGLPIMVYLAYAGGNLEIMGSDDLTALRWVVLASSAVVIGTLYFCGKRITRPIAYVFIAIYAAWMMFILYSLS